MTQTNGAGTSEERLAQRTRAMGPLPLPGGLLALQFERQPDGSWWYRRDNVFPPRVVSEEERNRFVRQGNWTLLWAMALLFTVVLVVAGIQTSLFGDVEGVASWTVFLALMFLGGTIYYLGVRWMMHAPWRAVRHRSAVGPARTRKQLMTPFIKARSYREIATDCAIGLGVVLVGTWLSDDMPAVVPVICTIFFVGLAIAGAIIKYRAEHQ